MKIFKTTETKKQETSTVRELTATELQTVGGGINPQPLPPCRSAQI